MKQAMGSRARILVNKTLNSGAVDHVMGVWLGGLILAALFVWLSPPPDAGAAVSPKGPAPRVWILTAAERHCMVQTALGEATPNHKAEVIAIMRGMLARRASGRWGDLCGVVLAPRQYSVYNDKAMPGKPKKPSKQYRRYSAWADLALAAGPSRFDHYFHGRAMLKLYGRSRPYWARACVETVRVGGATLCRMA